MNDPKGMAMDDTVVDLGDVIEFTHRGERRTAEAMLVTDGGEALLDLFDGDRLVWARLADLDDVVVFRPDPAEILAAA